MIEESPGSRRVMISLAFLATTITYIERQALSVVVPVLMERFPVGGLA